MTLTDIQSHFKMFVDFDISNDTLTVHYMINEEDEMTEYPYEQFEAWVEKQYAEHGLIWIYPYPTQNVPEPLPYALEVWEYIEENQTELVTEFWNSHK